MGNRFGSRFIDELTTAEIQDYLDELYHLENRAYSYTESFLKMFYLLFGQAYSRIYIDVDFHNRFCVNKDTKIHMPKLKIDDDQDIVYFNDDELKSLTEYFTGTNADNAYLLGRYCGLRINECYGLKWSNIDIKKGLITIDRQMQYQDGLIILVSLKTRNARRSIYMNSTLREYFKKLATQKKEDEKILYKQREQNQTMIQDLDGHSISSLELVNFLSNGKIQTVNSMKHHCRQVKSCYGITFKHHYLRHTYGTNLAALNTPEYILCNQIGTQIAMLHIKYYIAIFNIGVSELQKIWNLSNLENQTIPSVWYEELHRV